MALDTESYARVGLGEAQVTAVLAGILIALWAWFDAPRASLGLQAVMLVASTVALLIAAWRPDRKAGGASFLYFAVLGLFHFGLLLAIAVEGSSALIGQGDNSWVRADRTAPAVGLTAIGLASAGVGTFIAARVPRRGLRPDREYKVPLGTVGIAATCVGGIGVLLGLAGGGIRLLRAGYIDVIDSVQGSSTYSYGLVLFGFGLVLMVANHGRTRVAGWAVMVSFALIALPLGLRGPVIFPLLALVMVEARARRVGLMPFTLVSIAALTAISLLRQTRIDGFAGLFSGGWSRVHPVDGAAEMGYSLYPVVVVQDWMEEGAEPFYGVTLVAPVLRLLESLLGLDTVPGASDYRLFNVEVMARVGPIGGSPIAEGHRNLATTGVVLVMLLIAVVLARIDTLPATPLGTAIAGVVFLPLISTVRNSLAPTLPQIFIGFLLIWLALAIARATERRRR